MSLDNYRNVLLDAVKKYENEKGKRLSIRRKRDIDDLRKILQDRSISNPLSLKLGIEARLSKIRTGWWIFQTGNSKLKNSVSKIISLPDYCPKKIMQAEIEATQRNLTELKTNAQQLSKRIEAQNDKILENTIHIKLQDLRVGKKQIYLSYEEYIIHLLDKFIMNYSLHIEESSLLIDLLKNDQLDRFDEKKKRIISEKMADACKFAFRTSTKGIDHLIKADQLQHSTFNCLIHYTDYFCRAVKPQSCKSYSRFEGLMKKLLHSYYLDGAGRTKVSGLSAADKDKVLEAKEILICQYGDTDSQNSIAPLCELRKDSRWDEFTNRCIEKGRYLFQWLKDKKSASKINKHNNHDLKPEIVLDSSASNSNNKLSL